MKIEKVIDYAYPCMLAEGALKQTHHSVLQKDFDSAISHAINAITECRLMLAALKDMKEREDALRQQTQTV